MFTTAIYTNAKLERMFSRMKRVKSDWCSSLSRGRLDTLLRIREDGPSIFDFNPATSIDAWYAGAVQRLNFGPHKYPEKRKRCDGSGSSKDTVYISLSDKDYGLSLAALYLQRRPVNCPSEIYPGGSH